MGILLILACLSGLIIMPVMASEEAQEATGIEEENAAGSLEVSISEELVEEELAETEEGEGLESEGAEEETEAASLETSISEEPVEEESAEPVKEELAEPEEELTETDEEEPEKLDDPKKPETMIIEIDGIPVEVIWIGEAGAPQQEQPMRKLRSASASTQTIAGTKYKVYRIYNSGSEDSAYIMAADLDGDGIPETFPTDSGTYGHVYVVDIDGEYHMAYCANESIPGGHRLDHLAGEYTGEHADAMNHRKPLKKQ